MNEADKTKPCPECGGSGWKCEEGRFNVGDNTYKRKYEPCPECGDLVKELRCAIKDYRKIYSRRLFPAAYKVVDKAEQAADRLEQQSKEIAELKGQK